MTDQLLFWLILGPAILLPGVLLASVLVTLLVAQDRGARAAAREPLPPAEADGIYKSAQAAALAEIQIRDSRKGYLLFTLFCAAAVAAALLLLPELLRGELFSDGAQLVSQIAAAVFALLGTAALGYAAIGPVVYVNLHTLRIALLTPAEVSAARERDAAAAPRAAREAGRQ